MSILEAIMLLCFGAAWPFSIARSIKAKSTKGKSVFFLIILLCGYAAGIANKLLYNYDFVLYLYILNFLMVSTDTVLWFRNRKIERSKE
jgi:hypothetical protein